MLYHILSSLGCQELIENIQFYYDKQMITGLLNSKYLSANPKKSPLMNYLADYCR